MTETLPDLTVDATRVASMALAEDGQLDLTTAVTIRKPFAGEAVVEARSNAVVAGLMYAETAARAAGCSMTWSVTEGAMAGSGDWGRIRGDLAAVLRAERPILNLLQRAAGIATATREYVEAVAGTRCRILHTRKTAPGLRLFDVVAVVAGGGAIHRIDLAHTVMVKDNHWRSLAREGRSLRDALAAARERGAVACQVECETEAQVREGCAAGADRLLVDNQSPETVRTWGALARELRPGITIEATGGITLANVRQYAEAEADFVSIGALTHSVRAMDIALRVV